MEVANTIYLALLRGINVGGKAKVEMGRLRKVFEELGCGNVSTYINSGNVIFTDTRSDLELVRVIEAGIAKEFGLSVPVVVRSQAEIEVLLKKVPQEWTNNAEQKTDVLFLWAEVDKPSVVKSIDYKPEVEQIIYVPGAVVWNVDRKHIKQGSGVKLIGTELYRKMTARNINTVRKLAELMRAGN